MLVVVVGMKLAPVKVETMPEAEAVLARRVEMLWHQVKQVLAVQV
jgi:hypothetical protein